jgi:transposase
MRKRFYSAKRFSAKELEQLLSNAGDSSVVIGVDVAKHELMLMARRQDARFFGPYRVVNPHRIDHIVELMQRLHARGPAQIAMESSGTYGDPLRQALSQAQLQIQRVESKWSWDYAELFDGVPSQHDGKDAAVIAELCAIGKCSPWPWTPPDENESRIRLLVEWIDGQDRTCRLWSGRIEGLLARHWPEATAILDLSSGTLMRAVIHYGGPSELAADPKALENLRRWGHSLLSEEKAQALLDSAKASVGVKQNAFDQERLRRYAQAALAASLEIKRAKPQLKILAAGNPVIQIQGAVVGIVTACVLWTRLGDPNNYHAAEAYRKAMGLNLAERSSGRYKGQLHISKRGDRMARRWLHLAALRLLHEYPHVRDWYRQKRIRDGGRHLGALTAVVRHLAIALHKSATRNQPLDGARLFAGMMPQTAKGGS